MSAFPLGHRDRPTVSADVHKRATCLPTSGIGLVEESFNILVEVSKLAAYTGLTPPCRAYRIFNFPCRTNHETQENREGGPRIQD